ncbi:MAG: hypothetical protein KF862_08975 [Chitinophagaceae bacterium]|nr:hypothetical protein [Chitinophagaceae bacterium]
MAYRNILIGCFLIIASGAVAQQTFLMEIYGRGGNKYVEITTDSCACHIWGISLYNVSEKKYQTANYLGGDTKEKVLIKLEKELQKLRARGKTVDLFGLDHSKTIGPYCSDQGVFNCPELKHIRRFKHSPEFASMSDEEKQKAIISLLEKKQKGKFLPPKRQGAQSSGVGVRG